MELSTNVMQCNRVHGHNIITVCGYIYCMCFDYTLVYFTLGEKFIHESLDNIYIHVYCTMEYVVAI